MLSTNVIMIQTVAQGLGELKDEIVFIGGAVAELYATNPAASDIRPTLDVDCVIELKSRMKYAELEQKLRVKKFVNDISEDAPICRWIYRDVKIDIMPTDSTILGFSNKWYSLGIQNKMNKTLPDGTNIFIFPPAFYLATKFESHKNRGGNDLRQSHDFEDIIYLFDNCTELLNSIQNTVPSVQKYLKEECQNLLKNENLKEGVECALPFGSDADAVEIILDLFHRITEI